MKQGAFVDVILNEISRKVHTLWVM